MRDLTCLNTQRTTNGELYGTFNWPNIMQNQTSKTCTGPNSISRLNSPPFLPTAPRHRSSPINQPRGSLGRPDWLALPALEQQVELVRHNSSARHSSARHTPVHVRHDAMPPLRPPNHSSLSPFSFMRGLQLKFLRPGQMSACHWHPTQLTSSHAQTPTQTQKLVCLHQSSQLSGARDCQLRLPRARQS